MILGRSAFFVTPSDSVALIAAHAVSAIPYFKGGLKGLSRFVNNNIIIMIYRAINRMLNPSMLCSYCT